MSSIDQEVAALLHKAYFNGRWPDQIKLLADGRNQVFEVTQGEWRGVVKASRQDDSVVRLKRHTAVAQVLNMQGLAAERMITTAQGECLAHNESGLTLAVFEKIDGSPGKFTTSCYAELGSAMATWHQGVSRLSFEDGVLAELSPLRIVGSAETALHGLLGDPPRPRARHRSDSVPTIVNRHELLARWDACLRFLFEAITALGEQAYCVGHGDAHPLNRMFETANDGQLRGSWIDLEDAYWGSRLFDLGTLVWSTLRQGQTAPFWRTALESYDRVASLSARELNDMGFHVALRQVWWLALHARCWGHYPIHQREPQFMEAGIELLELICADACGARLNRSA